MKLKLLATAISSTLLIGCGSDDSLPKVTEGTYYNATPLTIGEFTTVTINSGEQLEAFKVTVPSTGSSRTITTVIDIVEPTPYAEFWYQDKSVLFGQLMPEQDIHDAVNRDDAEPDSLLYISEAFRTPFLEPQDTIIEQAFATFDDEGVAQPFSTTDETFYFYVRSPEYSIQPTLTNAIESLSYPLELRVGVFEQSQDAFCSDEEDGIQCITEAPHENYHCGLIDGQGELGACEGIVTFEPVSAISGKDTVSVVEQWPNASETNMAVFSGNGTVGLDPVWMVNNFPENAQFYLSNYNTPEVTFYADTVGEYEITLTVINEIGRPSTATHVINVVADSDGDGIVDGEDPDADGDGYVGAEDLFPNDKASHRDSDGDGVSNYAQEDEDGDGVVDYLDAYPFNSELQSLELYSEPADERFLNDGITIAEQTGLTAPLALSGEFYEEVGLDQDFYAITLNQGRITVNVDAGGLTSPIISVLQINGRPLPSKVLTDESSQFDASQTVIVPETGTYYLSITGEVSERTPYSVNLINDIDQDGISDEVEIALDSNELNADTDGDQIPDGVEISMIQLSLSDLDGDGVPTWWDLESDGDNLPDILETNVAYPQNPDGDNALNFVDTDSDGDGTIDIVEAGSNPLSPVDTDSDGIVDVYDIDDDNDGLSDDIDPNRIVATEPEPDPFSNPDSFGIKNISYLEFENTGACLVGSTIELDIVNIPSSADLSVVLRKGNELKSVPFEFADGLYKVTCTEDMVGQAGLSAISDGKITVSHSLNVLSAGSIALTDIEYNDGRLRLSGLNLNQPYTIRIGEFSQFVDNDTFDNATYDSVRLDAGYDDGFGTIESNGYTVGRFLVRDFNEQMTVDVSSFSVPSTSSLLVDTGNGEEYELTTDVEQAVSINSRSAQRVAVFEKVGDSSSFELYWIGGGISLPWLDEVAFDYRTMALSLFVEALPFDLSDESNKEVYEELLNSDEISALASFIETKISEDKSYMTSTLNLYDEEVYIDALDYVMSQPKQNIVAASSTEIPFLPGEIDDIKVISNGYDVIIENDTRLHLSVRAVSENGNIIDNVNYVDSVTDHRFVSPQYGLFSFARESLVYSGLQTSTVRAVSGGQDAQHQPMNVSEITLKGQKAMDYAMHRTVVEEIIVPLFSTVLENGIGVKNVSYPLLRDLFLKYEGSFFVIEFVEGANAYERNLPSFASSFASDYLDLMIAAGSDLGVQQAVAKIVKLNPTIIAARWAVRAVPILGWLKNVKDLGALSVDLIPIGKTVVDIYNTDAAIDFNYETGLKLDSITPSTISPDGKSRQIEIRGEGFLPKEVSDFWGITSQTYRPMLHLTNTQTNEVEGPYTLNYVYERGTLAKIQLPGTLFKEDGVSYDAKILFDFGDGQITQSETLSNAIEVKDELVLDSLSTSSSYPSGTFEIRGSGFNIDSRLNRVYIGDTLVSPVSSDLNSMLISIPLDIENGDYDVFVQTVDSEGKVIKQSNSLTLTIAASETVIRICDSGNLKDDNFKLTVNNVDIAVTSTTPAKYCFDYDVTLLLGENNVRLTGVDAPDGIGTYEIVFPSNVRVVGDRTIGDDLAPDQEPKRFKVYLDNAEPQAIVVPEAKLNVIEK